MSDITEFGFEDSKQIKTRGMDRFKLNRSGEVGRISIIAFKKFSDVIISHKTKEKGAPLSDDEKAELIAKIDGKLKQQLGKEELTDVDRLDVKHARFAYAFTHYKDGLGSIRCLSKYSGSELMKPELCCKEIGDAEQQIATICMVYPTEEDGSIDMDLLKMKKRIFFNVLRMSAKKFKRIESTYNDARNAETPMHTIDLKLTLDGDPKYQKFAIENGMTAAWLRQDADPELRQWVLEQGLRSWKYVKDELGFEMTRDRLVEKLRGGSGSSSDSGPSQAEAPNPQIQGSYDDLLS